MSSRGACDSLRRSRLLGAVPSPFSAPTERETEGFGIMAKDMGHECWGLPNLEIGHAEQ